MNVVCHLRLQSTRHPVAAIFLRGSSTIQWVNEIARWPVDQTAIRLHIVSGRDRHSIAGLLVIVPGQHMDELMSVQPCGIAYGQVHPRFFIPIDAEIVPRPLESEIDHFAASDDAVYVWLPNEGLIRCDQLAEFRLEQLLSLSAFTSVMWDYGVPGEALPSRLLSIEVPPPPDADEIMETVRGDIGRNAGSMSQLPVSPREMTMRRILRPWILMGLAGILLIILLVSVLRSMPGLELIQILGAIALVIAAIILVGYLIRRWDSASQSRMSQSRGRGVNPQGRAGAGGQVGAGRGGLAAAWGGMVAWVSRGMAQIGEQLDALRHREIDRLLHMLDASPDEGLKYAIPVDGAAAPRGVAAPGSRLMQRIVDFSVGRIGGGGPVDAWNIDPQYSLRLHQKYRELANREIALGRHRRAAYIFAVLLGDLRNAAATLADGGYLREAATLYEQRLNDPRAAAICLERGGLLTEAIPYYERFAEFEKVAELYEKLEQFDFATAAYRRAVEARSASGDFLTAARLLETKLHAPSDGYDMLVAGWPHSLQAQNCLEESFFLLSRMADHGRARQRIHTLTDDCPSAELSTQLARCFARLTQRYPDHDVQSDAADRTRALISRWLNEANHGQRRLLLDSLQQLTPEDRLLVRDCHRFLGIQQERTPVRKAIQEKIRMIGMFELPTGSWQTAISHGRGFYAAGSRGEALLLVRGLWDGQLQHPSGVPGHLQHANAPLVMGIATQIGARLLLHRQGHSALTCQCVFASTDQFGRNFASGFAAFSESTFSFRIIGQYMACLQLRLPFVIETYQLSDGRLLGTWNIPMDIFEDGPTIMDFVLHEGLFCMGTSEGCVVLDLVGGKVSGSMVRDVREIRNLSTFAKHPARLAACCQTGGMVWWGDPREHRASVFGKDLHQPVAGFLRSGILAAADDESVEFYDTTDEELKFLGKARTPGDRAIALVELPNASQVALFTQSGHVRIYEVAVR